MKREVLYDFNEAMSRARSYFNLDNVEYLQSIDSMRGICTASAMLALSKILSIKKDKDTFKLGGTGARLKLKKIGGKDKFQFEIYALSQFYKHSKEALRQKKELCRYISTHQRFDIEEVDIAIDMPEQRKPLTSEKQQWHKGTLYIQTKDANICIYDKVAKHANNTHGRNLPKKLIRHEVTLKLAKNRPPEKPRKVAKRVKSQTRPPLIRNNIRILKRNYNTKKSNNYSVRDFYYKYLAKKCKIKPQSKETKSKKLKNVKLE